MGARARELLSRPDFSGRVLAVVSNAVYLSASDQEILWLAREKSPPHSRGIIGESDQDTFHMGMSCRCQGTKLLFDGGAVLDWSRAEVWRPAPVGQVTRRDIVSGCARQLLAGIRALDPGESLGCVIPLIMARMNGESPPSISVPSQFVVAALPLVDQLV